MAELEKERLENIIEGLSTPENYFDGQRGEDMISINNILIYRRSRIDDLQQNAFENLSHYRFVFIVNLQTSGVVCVDSSEIMLEEGHCLLILPYQFHTFSELVSDDLNWLFLTFESPYQEELTALSKLPLKLDDTEFYLLEQVVESYHQGKTFPNLTIQRFEYFLESMRYRVLQRNLQEIESKGPLAEQNKLITLVNCMLYNELEDGVTISDIADEIDISERLLRMRFKEGYGISLGKYITQFKVNRAIQYLHNPRMPIRDIAQKCGFANVESFSRFFKIQTGGSPKAYQKKIKE